MTRTRVGLPMGAKRVAEADWENDLLHGHGRVKGHSGALPEMGISWSARTEASDGKTSPEELLAAAHASCFSMAFSNTLAKMQKPPTHLHVTATVSFDKVGDGWSVTTVDLDVVGTVPQATASEFAEAAKTASVNCPISRALKGNVEIRVNARLA
jgi:osmotically inducible protein OsmC